MSPRPALVAEFAGTAALAGVVVGSGIMGVALAGGNAALALLANSLATAAALVVLISRLAPVSGAHLNPLVSLMAWADGELTGARAIGHVLAQVLGAVAGVVLAHAMFDLPPLQLSATPRATPGLRLSEVVATVALLAVVRGCRGAPEGRAAWSVALVVFAGYWAAASTCFANPALTLARALTDTFAGIRPDDVPGFILAQAAGLGLLLLAVRLRR